MESNHYFQSKLPKLKSTVFSVMTELANKHGAINLSQGFPNFPVSSELCDLLHKATLNGKNQYAPMAGAIELREAIAEKVADMYEANYDVQDEITITSGATQALFTAITAIVSEGDEVIIFTPAYDSYEPAIKLSKGKPVFVQTLAPDYKIDWQKVQTLVNSRTKMIIVNTPHNPTGTVLDETDMLKLQKIINNTNIVVLSDEVYEHIVFGDYSHESICKYPGLLKQSVVVSSFGKTFHATGWKIGYCLAPARITEEIRKIHQYMVFSVNTPAQHALAEYLKNPDHYKNLPMWYEKKRDLFSGMVKGSKFKALPCHGTYFQLLSYKEISKESDVDFAERLTKQYKLASIPISVFYNDNIDQKILRFCFAKDDDTLKKAAEILHQVK